MDNSVSEVNDSRHWLNTMSNEGDMVETLGVYVMCGGGGTRLWPLSRADNPKQNLALTSEHSMLAETAARVAGAKPDGMKTILNLMGGAGQTDQLGTVLSDNAKISGSMIVEPFGKNTAPAVAAASLHALHNSGTDPYVLILPSDHVIRPIAAFQKAITLGLEAANNGEIVVFGVEPNHPATGYGYIEVANKQPVSPILSFKEKPDLETATHYATSGRHLWNAGIFLFRASTMVSALEEFAPAILKATAETLNKSPDLDGVCLLDAEQFAKVPADSIDFAVMEQADNVTVVCADFEWHDVGSFASLHAVADKDAKGNAIFGDVIALECKDSLLHSEGPLVSAIGVENLAIVATPDVTMVAPLERAEEIRSIVAKMEADKRIELQKSPWLSEAGTRPGSMNAPLTEWLLNESLPYWATNGLDHSHGGFHEILSFDGESKLADKRLRTMARQIYVYAKSMEQGWNGDAKSIVRHGLKFLNESPESPKGGWYKTFDHQSSPLDLTEDTYDHAFVLLALAQAKKADCLEDDTLPRRVINMLDSLRIVAADGAFKGYAEDTKNSLPRRSNPHMHLLEAWMAWYEASGELTALERAKEIVDLFDQHLFDKDRLVLIEQFDAHLKPLRYNASKSSSQIEPGHHFEWAHLLLQYAELSKTPPMPQIAGLMATAKAYGTNPVTGLAQDMILPDGKPHHQSARCWVQTEMLSAFSCLSTDNKSHFQFEAERCAERLWTHYLKPAPKGMWVDVVDGRGRPVSQSVPASTLYHLINGISHYSRYVSNPT